MRSMHSQARAAQDNFAEFLRLIAVLNDDSWCTPATVSQATGRPVDIAEADRGNAATAAHRVMYQALTDVIAECLHAGVSRASLTQNRGWLSISDLNRMTGRASAPRPDEIRAEWPQSGTLDDVKKTIAHLTSTRGGAEANRLARSSRNFLRQWTTTIPTTPPEDVIAQIAVVFRRDHAKAWKQARTDLLADIRELGFTKTTPRGDVVDRTPRD